jgi:hypothetical protein
MKYARILALGILLTSTAAFAKDTKAKGKRHPSSAPCEQEAKDAAAEVYYKKYPQDKGKYQVIADVQSHRGNTIHYLVDFLDGVSDGASSTEFSVGEYNVTVHTGGGKCEVDEPEFVKPHHK